MTIRHRVSSCVRTSSGRAPHQAPTTTACANTAALQQSRMLDNLASHPSPDGLIARLDGLAPRPSPERSVGNLAARRKFEQLYGLRLCEAMVALAMEVLPNEIGNVASKDARSRLATPDLPIYAILITTLTTELSMLPVAFKLAKNSETMQGMAVVIVGGLLASTLLTLLLLPTFYLMFEKFKKKKMSPEKAGGKK